MHNVCSERARVIEQRKRNRILQKEMERDKKLQEFHRHLKETRGRSHSQYRQSVKYQSDLIEESRRNRYLKKLENKEERYRLTQSKRDEETYSK